MQIGSSNTIRRGFATLAAATLLASSLFGAVSVSAQDAATTPGVASPPATLAAASTPIVIGESTPIPNAASTSVATVDTSGCWADPANNSLVYPQWLTAPQMVIDPAGKYTAVIKTNMGDITVELYADKAPNTVNNFVCLAGNGFYDKTYFHRILAGFVIQGGDPTATGRGGPGYKFGDELPTDLNYDAGALAMANSGPNTNGSQFFITLDTLTDRLPKSYSIFGKVTGGMDVVALLAQTPVTTGASGEASAPTAPAGIVSITITKQ